MFKKVSIVGAVAAAVFVFFVLSISYKFSYDLGKVNARLYYDRAELDRILEDRHEILPFDQLYAAQLSAEYSFAQVVVAYLALVVSGCALVGLAVSLRQTREAMEISRSMGEVEATCYLHASSVEWSKRGRLVLHCSNTGNTPATHFSIGAHAYNETRGHISENLNFNPTTLKTWSALPGNSKYTVSIDEIDFTEIDQFLQNPDDPLTVLVVCGNIYYTNVFGKTFRTQFAFYTNSAKVGAKFARPTARLDVHCPVKQMPIEIG